MNLLLFSSNERINANTQLKVTGPRLQHLREVHKKAVADSVRVGEINGLMGSATILEISADAALLELDLNQPPPEKLPLVLVLALPRPKMLRRILRAAAEFGVAELILINSYRVEKSYWQTPALKTDTITQYLLQGLEQSKDTVLPAVTLQRRFKPFVEDELPQLIGDSRALVAHPGNYPPCPRDVSGRTVLVIGPEGGLIPYEVAMLEAAGCEPVSLGPRILRVENAVTSLFGRLF